MIAPQFPELLRHPFCYLLVDNLRNNAFTYPFPDEKDFYYESNFDTQKKINTIIMYMHDNYRLTC